jgi:DNA-directed RNA polymerase subunit RPC12/RpoP
VINWDCLECGQNLDADDDLAGLEIECPSCGKTIVIPQSGGPPAGESAPSDAGSDSGDQEDQKSSTIRLDLPSDAQVPKPHQRVIKFKRRH